LGESKRLVDKCPVCKTPKFETTIYEEEGGYCTKCNVWIVPQSSAEDIYASPLCSKNLNIQFHKKCIPSMTWKEFYDKCGKMEKEN
jgi:hypothetical protein